MAAIVAKPLKTAVPFRLVAKWHYIFLKYICLSKPF
jgi:hypothetical protein